MSKDEERKVSSMPAVAVFVTVVIAVVALYLGGLFVTNKSTDVVEAAEPDEKVEVIDETNTSPLPTDYVLIVNSGDEKIVFEIDVRKIIRNSDNSVVVRTSLMNELIFDNGTCTIIRANGLVESFTDYTFLLKKNYTETTVTAMED